MDRDRKRTDTAKEKMTVSEPDGVRINKFLSEAGVCSRREADRAVAAGQVTMDGRPAGVGDRVFPENTVCFRGKEIRPEEEDILLAFHKPAGVVCTSDRREPDNIIDYLRYPKRIYPIGRLDKSSEGLILLTNRGDLVNRILRAGNYHEKEYQVTVDRNLTDDALRGMREGIYLEELDVTTRPCKVTRTGKRTFTIVLTQGLNRQIRRMCEACGCRVTRLVRVRVLNIKLGDLPVGSYRAVTPEERAELEVLLRDSYSAPRAAGRKEPAEKTKPDDRAKAGR